MTISQSTRSRKPSKPRKDFPLFAHASGQWAKKVAGKLSYFGTWDDPEAAERLYDKQKDDLRAGRRPKPSVASKNGVTVADIVNSCLTTKEIAVQTGELSQRHFNDLLRSGKEVAKHFGSKRLVSDIHVDEWSSFKAVLAKQWKTPANMRREITNVRSLFNFAVRNGMIQPILFGDGFRAPTAKHLKKARQENRAEHGDRCFTAEQVRTLVKSKNASPDLRAMILLAINCGLGNADCKSLKFGHLDLDGGWLDFPRGKTGNERRCKLWPETTEALRQVIASRREPKNAEHESLVFITQYRGPWGTVDQIDCPISKAFRRLAIDTGTYRKGLTFYSLRHSFRTIADGTLDQPAVNLVMGHDDKSMASIYRERIDDARLVRIADHVRQWLFGEVAK